MSSAMVSNADVGPAVSVSARGLHGHSLEGGAATALLAECIGTCILVLTIIGTVIAASLARPVAGLPYGSLAVPLAAGAVLTSLVAALGPISGAHLNPALTVGLAINGRFGWARVTPYVASQLFGAVVAALIAWELYGSRARSVANLGATYPARGVGVGQALIAEAIVTFALASIVVFVASIPCAASGLSAIAIGFALAGAIFVSGPVSGGAVNPARQ
jgi:glycerol uptake facilitator-like aquaporin